MKSNNRNSSVELLRMLTMCGVVLLHYNNPNAGAGLAYASGINYGILVFVESMFICAVDLYVLISGYFLSASSKRRVSKLLELLVQTALIGAALQCVSALLAGNLSIKGVLVSLIPNNYFVTLYVAMYLISPYVNLVLERLSDSGVRLLTGLVLFLFSVWPTLVEFLEILLGVNLNGFVPISSFGSNEGYTVVNFLMMYLLGAYIRANEERLLRVSAGKYLMGFLGGSVILTVWVFTCKDAAWPVIWAYCNPLVVLMACCLLIAFMKWKFQSKTVNHLAKSAFTCYLVHGVMITRIGVDRVVQASAPVMFGHMLISVIGIYAACHVCYLIWNAVMGPVFRLLSKKMEKWDGLLIPQVHVQ